MEQETLNRPGYSLTLTSAAEKKLAQLLAAEKPGLALRVRVKPGGCAGLRHQLSLTDEYAALLGKELAECTDEGFAEADSEEEAVQRAAMISARDSVVWFGQFAAVIDDKSGPLLDGACIDFSDTPQRQGFTIYSPNARGMCLRRLDSLASGHQPPLAWLCAQEDALALITANAPEPLPAFVQRAARDVLALTLMLGGAPAPRQVPSALADLQRLVADDVEWALWCQACLDYPPAGLTAADIKMARLAWRWLERSRLLRRPAGRACAPAMTFPGIGVPLGVAFARHIAGTAQRRRKVGSVEVSAR